MKNLEKALQWIDLPTIFIAYFSVIIYYTIFRFSYLILVYLVISLLALIWHNSNDSIVLHGKLYGKNFLFTGDLEEPGERELLAHYPTLAVDVLKAGHHGSKTSSSEPFVKAINPSIALISCGLDNRYGHPSTETLMTFRRYGIQIFRTDESGAIKFEKNSKSWHISTVK
ncbi:MAG: ComEC/Rec2 family competence protein [Pseudolactococcus laudensis]